MMRNTLREYTVTVPAGQVVYLAAVGNGVQLRDASVDLRVKNEEIGLDILLSAGDGVDGLDEFTEIQLTHSSGVSQSFTIAVGVGVASSRSALVAGLPAEQGGYTQAAATVTNASAQLVAAKADRRFLLIQNNGTGDIYLNLAGDAATTASGVKIAAAGGVLLLDRYTPTAAIYAIGSIASNPSIIVVEG